MLPSSSFRVLLVEDDDDSAALVATELDLTSAGTVALQRARTLTEAVSEAPESGYDAVLLDLGLPDSAGLDTVTRLHAAAPNLPIVVLTGRDDDQLAMSAVRAGAQDYLVKGTADGQLLMRSLRYATERKQAATLLQKTEEQLRQAQKMEAVGRLAGGVAHDFNNVLTAIFGYTDLLLDQFDGDDPRRVDVEEIRRSAERAATLTRQLLAFSRKQILQPKVVDLNQVIAGIQPLLTRLVGEDITLTVHAEPSLWRVRADPGQVEQVLMNLAANARDAMPEGGPLSIATANRHVDAAQAGERTGLRPGAYAVISVTDGGCGMPPTVREHIFEPFFTTKEQGKGTGLGLATVYGIVKQSGGGVYVDSEEGRGTTVEVLLPPLPAP